MKPVFYLLFAAIFSGCSFNSNLLPDNSEANKSIVAIDSLISISKEEFYILQPDEDVFDTYLEEAFEIAENENNREAVFNIYILLAKRFRNMSDYSSSIEQLQLAQDVANELDNNELRAYATHEMAVNFRRIDDHGQAMKYHVQALEWAENANDTFLIHCSLNGIGNVHFEYKDYKLAIDYFHRSLQYLGKVKPNLLGEAINTNTIGEAWLLLGNTDSALIYLERSLQINFYINSELGQAICFNGIGMVYHEKKDYVNAIKAYKSALELYEGIGDLFYETMCLNNLGKTYHVLKDYKNAVKTYEKSFEIASKIGSKRFALAAAIELSGLYHEINSSNKSFLYNKIGMAYKDSITKELRNQNTEAMNVLYEAEKQKREILILKQEAELNELKLSRQKYLFLSIAVVFVVVIVIAIFIYRQRQLQSKINEIGLEQKLLRAQLNPHFIFNSLSAVQNFIIRNDQLEAADYLAHFSRLMRNILMGSGMDFITIENELEILDDYLKLQQLRFGGKFDYEFDISDELDQELCMVPPMLLQPFVENSIEHGLKKLKERGIIFIRFKKEDAFLNIEIQDNGVGLQDSNKSEDKKNHISMATKITRQRMQNLQALTKKPCIFEVIDNPVNNGSGVLVRITIPMKCEA